MAERDNQRFALDLDRVEDVLAIHDRHVWAEVKEYSQDQVNAVSLLARADQIIE